MRNVTRRSVLTCAASLLAMPSAGSTQSGLVEYKSFQKQSLQLRPFVGRHVALLLDPPRSVESAIVDRVLSAIDRAVSRPVSMRFWRSATVASSRSKAAPAGAAGGDEHANPTHASTAHTSHLNRVIPVLSP